MSRLLRAWPWLAPWLHTGLILGAGYFVTRGWEPAAVLALVARAGGLGLAWGPQKLARRLAPLLPEHYLDRTMTALAHAQDRVDQAVDGLTVIRAELQMIGDRLHTARTRLPKDGGTR